MGALQLLNFADQSGFTFYRHSAYTHDFDSTLTLLKDNRFVKHFKLYINSSKSFAGLHYNFESETFSELFDFERKNVAAYQHI